MKYLEEIRDGEQAKKIIKKIIIKTDPNRHYFFLDFSVSRTHPIHRFSLDSYLPANFEWAMATFLPFFSQDKYTIDTSVLLAQQAYTIFCCYTEFVQMPGGKNENLLTAKSHGSDIHLVYSIYDAIHFATENPERHVIFLAVGFEADMINTAKAIKYAKELNLKNFKIFCKHQLALTGLQNVWMDANARKKVTGVILPMNNSPAQLSIPSVISGFQPIDILESLYLLLCENNESKVTCEQQYPYSIYPDLNQECMDLLQEVFFISDTDNRTVHLASQYSDFDIQSLIKVAQDSPYVPLYRHSEFAGDPSLRSG